MKNFFGIIFFISCFSYCPLVEAQKRVYFTTSTAAAVNPAYDANWEYTVEAGRYKLADSKGTSAITIGGRIGPWTGGGINNALDRQYVSTRMSAGIQFVQNSTTLKGYLMVREYANTDNVNGIFFVVKIVSEDGNILRVVGRTIQATGTINEFVNNPSHRNKQIFDPAGSLWLGSSYTTVEGDRLVIEIGYLDVGGGTTPEASAKWGENATDLPANETQTTNGAGWIEFSNNITFIGESAKPRRVTLIE